MFLLVSRSHLCVSKGHQHGISKQSHLIWANVNPNILHMNYCTDLILGKAFCIIIYLLSFPRCRTFCFDWFAFSCLMAWQRKHRIRHKQYAPHSVCYFSLPRIKIQQFIIVWHYLVFLHPVFSMSIKIVCTKSVGSFESGRFVLINKTLFAPLKTAWNLFSWTVPFNSSTSLARAFSTSSSSSSSLELLGWSPWRLCSGPYNWSAYWKLLP